MVKIRACLTAGRYRSAHKKSDTPKATAERKGRNPSTGQEITIAASKKPTFTAGKSLKDAVA